MATGIIKRFADREADWRNGAVVYQCFVDRFVPCADLDKKRSLYGEGCVLKEWHEPPKPGSENKNIGYWQHEVDFWGGDLPSLMTKFDYISKDLGMDVLYLQPVSEAYSNHKYDTTNYLKLDAQYGTDEDFSKLVSTVHDAGMHLMLDGVFNHLGARNAEFQKAKSGEDPKAKDWFFLGKEFGPDGYKCWSCAPNLVELRLETPSCADYFWRKEDSVVAHWLKKGADGWRLDVASEIGYHFLKDITEHAHKHKPGSLIVGEVWAFPSKWNCALDGTLSLHSGQVIKGFVRGDCPGSNLTWAWDKLIKDSSIEAVLKNWLVLANHDMPRLSHDLPNMALRKAALALQFSLPGSPLLYYGDEIGMEGGDDPCNRGPFQWEKVNDGCELLTFVKQIVAIRKRLRALRIGDFTPIASQKMLAFMRTTDKVGETVIVLANGSEQPVREMVIVPNPDILGHTQLVDELDGGKPCPERLLGATFTMILPPKTVKIFSIFQGDSPSEMQYKRIYGHIHSLPSEKPFEP